MSGVIVNGVQYERCKVHSSPRCVEWPRIQDMVYEEPSEKYKYGRDMCRECGIVEGAFTPARTVRISFK